MRECTRLRRPGNSTRLKFIINKDHLVVDKLKKFESTPYNHAYTRVDAHFFIVYIDKYTKLSGCTGYSVEN